MQAVSFSEAAPEEIGRHLRALRRRKGLSLGEVARSAGLTRRELVAYEKGTVPIPESDLWCLAGSCGVDMADLLPPSVTPAVAERPPEPSAPQAPAAPEAPAFDTAPLSGDERRRLHRPAPPLHRGADGDRERRPRHRTDRRGRAPRRAPGWARAPACSAATPPHAVGRVAHLHRRDRRRARERTGVRPTRSLTRRRSERTRRLETRSPHAVAAEARRGPSSRPTPNPMSLRRRRGHRHRPAPSRPSTSG